MLAPLQNISPARFESPAILKQLATASRRLAEFKGIGASIPNQNILIDTLGLQEAKDSSAVENIVTTHDEIFRSAASQESVNLASKEVLRYNTALSAGLEKVRQSGLLTINHLCEVQAYLEPNKAGLRKLPGTNLKDNAGNIIYTPPQDHPAIIKLLEELEQFINDTALFDMDPLIKMSLIHHRFESIHPFYDGNGRTGRIANVLYLVKEGLLNIPILYLSRYIVQNKAEYYQRLQAVRDEDRWEDWVLYILKAIEQTSAEGIETIKAIRVLLANTKHRLRSDYSFYSQDLLNNLFRHPYTKIDFICKDLDVSRKTATKYLDQLAEDGFLRKRKIGRNSYYINFELFDILVK